MPKNYHGTQKLGASMRIAGVEAFQYGSARDPHKGSNVALFTPKAFQSKKPINFESWICSVTNNDIAFISKTIRLGCILKKPYFCGMAIVQNLHFKP